MYSICMDIEIVLDLIKYFKDNRSSQLSVQFIQLFRISLKGKKYVIRSDREYIPRERDSYRKVVSQGKQHATIASI